MADEEHDHLYQRHYRLQTRRGELVDTRLKVIEERSALKQRILEYQRAQGFLSSQIRSLTEKSPGFEDGNLLLKAVEAIHRPQDDMYQQLERTLQLEKILNQLESDVGKEENEFFGHLRTVVPLAVKGAQTSGKPSIPETERITRQEPEGKSDNLLRIFYDKSSDIPILEERLAELEYTFDYERAERETRADLGQPISPPDLEFYTQFNQDKETLGRELRQKKAEVARLQAECVQLGLLPAPPDVLQSDSGGEGKPDDIMTKARSWAHFGEPSEILDRSFLSDRHETIPAFVNPRERINEWLEKAQGSPGEAGEFTDDDGEKQSSNKSTMHGSGYGTPSDPRLAPQMSPSESWQEWQHVEEIQSRQKRNISEPSTISKRSPANQQPLPKSPRPS